MFTENYFRSEQLVELVYISRDGEITQRLVKVLGSNKEKVFGYCFLRKSYRSFNKEQILAFLPKRKRKIT